MRASRGLSLYAPALFSLLLFLDFDSLLSGFKFDVLISSAPPSFRPHPRLSLRTSPQRRPLEPPLATGSMTKSVQGEGEIQGRSHLLQGDRGKKRGRKQRDKKKRQKPSRWMEFFHSSRCFSERRLCAAGASSTRGRRKWLHQK